MRARRHDHAWLRSQAGRAISDILLGCVLAIAGWVAIANAQVEPSAPLGQMGPWVFPAAVGCALATIGAVLFIRGSVLRPGEPGRWSAAALQVIVPCITVLILAALEWGGPLLLMFGPSEFAALFVLILTVGIAIVRGSLLRAIGMALLGLLLGTIGIDVSSGSERFTFGMDLLANGISLPVLAFGLIIAADALVGLVSPSLLAATYVRQISGLANPTIRVSAALGLRALAAVAIAASVYGASILNNSLFDVHALLAFAVFGVACRILDWSRLVLLLAFALEPLLEENIRRALLISQGSIDIFVRWPLSATMLLLAGISLMAAALLAAFHALQRRRRPG